MMSASFVQHQKRPARCITVLSPLLRHVNTGSLAFILFVAFAFLSTTRGKEAETREPTPTGTSKSEVVIDKHHEFIGAVRPGTSDYCTESAQSYLKVYSATDEFNDGGLAYYSHSSYAIYTIDGKLFKSVENHISPSDESPELVALPAGSYLVIARSNREGDVRIRVAIKAGQLTVLDLGEKDGQMVSFARVVALGRQLIGGSRVHAPVVSSQSYENLHELRSKE